MERDCKYLFIYGSLLSTANHYGVYLKSNSRHIAAGCFNGLLYDMGEYPGALYTPKNQEKVYGDIMLLNSLDVLKIIDEYEGYGDNEAQPNLFIRKMLPITTTNAMIDCWVYLYNLSVSAYPQIASGKYTR